MAALKTDEILAFLNSHASARRFSGEEISETQEKAIVETAQRSPTSSNLQVYSIIGLRDAETKKRLAVLCGDQAHVSESSLFLVFLADLKRLKALAEERGYAFHGETAEAFIVATVDVTLVAGRALMAAQAMGIGGVMVGGIRNNPEEVCQLLQLPELVYPVMGMSLGYPQKPPKIKPRLPLSAVYMKDRYDLSRQLTGVGEYDRIMDELGHLRGREVEPEKYPGFNGVYSWSEHSVRRLASENPTVCRPHMKGFLQKRGFLGD
jgi:nitroreductase